MAVEIKVPEVGESITEVQIGEWRKGEGERAERDETVAVLETDKASVDLPCPVAGVIREVLKKEGETAQVGDVIAYVEEGEEAGGGAGATARKTQEAKRGEERARKAPQGEPEGRDAGRGKGGRGAREDTAAKESAERPAAREGEKEGGRRRRGKRETTRKGAAKAGAEEAHGKRGEASRREGEEAAQTREDARAQEAGRPEPPAEGDGGPLVMPAARRLLAEHGLEPRDVEATGRGGRLLKEDVLRHLEQEGEPEGEGEGEGEEEGEPEGRRAEPAPGGEAGRDERRAPGEAEAPEEMPAPEAPRERGDEAEEVVPMSRLRRRIAERLVRAQSEAALLTTFNEVDMSAVKGLRTTYRDTFRETYDTKLGFMSFFVKACVDALKRFPQLNAEVRDTDIVYRNRYDVSIAVGGGEGLVVPVIRDADLLSFAQIETTIADFARRAARGELRPDELQGGTFTISNGGIYGSLLSTPIVNPPQSGILGLHKIEDRPVARDGQVVIRPMMYVALTYDHRIVDGREAVTFLRRIKEAIEDPARMLIEV